MTLGKFTQKILNDDLGERTISQLKKIGQLAITECLNTYDFITIVKVAQRMNKKLNPTTKSVNDTDKKSKSVNDTDKKSKSKNKEKTDEQ